MNVITKHFSQLSTQELYEALRLRSLVFVVEQDCVYLDLDNLDQEAYHVFGWENDVLVAYARILAPGAHYTEPAIGRLVTHPDYRRRDFGKQIFDFALTECERIFETRHTRIMAQVYLRRFYEGFGYEQVSEEFLEDGIPHIEMLNTDKTMTK